MPLYRATKDGRVEIPADEEAIILAERAAEAIEAPIREADSQAKADLIELDKQSVRPIREWVAAQLTAPSELKAIEAEAIEKRKDIKPK